MLYKILMVMMISFLIAVGQSFGGKLDDFEETATKDSDHHESRVDDSDDDDFDDDDDYSVGEACLSDMLDGCLGDDCLSDVGDECFAEVISGLGAIIAVGGETSFKRVNENYDSDDPDINSIKDRELGEPLIPFVRIHYNYQRVDSDIDADDFRLEAGYGLIGFQIRKTCYKESNPTDELDMTQLHFLYRMSIDDVAEIDFGIGSLELDGNNKNDGTSYTLPVLINLPNHFGMEYRPTWSSINGNKIKDHDLALLYSFQYVSLRAGYRWVDASGVSLDGPFFGLSVQY